MDQQRLLNKTYFLLGWYKKDASGNVVVDQTCKFPLEATRELISVVFDDFDGRVPRKRVWSFATSPPVVDYDLPSNLDNIMGVYWRGDIPTISPDIPEKIQYSDYTFSNDLLENLLNTNSVDEIVQYQRNSMVDFDVFENKLKILSQLPVNLVAVVYKTRREVSELSNKFIETFAFKLASLAILAYVTGKERTSGIQRAGGIVEFVGGDPLLQVRKEYESEYEKKMLGWEKLTVLGLRDAD